MPVQLYVGGIEHAILHLLYSRFMTRFLHAEALAPSAEPFGTLVTQGMVLGRSYRDASGQYFSAADVNDNGSSAHLISDGRELSVVWEKMSKSKHNGVAPEEMVAAWGADASRLFSLFKAPVVKELQWDEFGK